MVQIISPQLFTVVLEESFKQWIGKKEVYIYMEIHKQRTIY